MKLQSSKLWQVVVCLLLNYSLVSCKSKHSKVKSHEVAWAGVAESKPIEFRIDGKKIETDITGLRIVLDFMKRCEKGTKLYFEAPTADWYTMSTQYHVDDHPLPFEVFRFSQEEDFLDAYYEIVKARDLEIVFGGPKSENWR